MNKKTILSGALLGALTSLPIIGIMYLGEQLAGLPFVPFDIFDWITRVLPGPIITFGIDLMVSLITAINIGPTSTVSKIAEQVMAIGQLVIGGAVFGVVLASSKYKNRNILTTYGLAGGLFMLAITLVIISQLGFGDAGMAVSSIWLAFLFLAWGWVLGALVAAVHTLGEKEEDDDEEKEAKGMSRRQFLSVAGISSLTIAAVAAGLGKFLTSDPTSSTSAVPKLPMPENDPFGASLTSGPAASPSPEALAARPAPPPGTRPELTPTEDFYRIDINTRSPIMPGLDWRLELFGEMSNPMRFSLDDLRAFPSVTQILTMQCISNRIGGDLTGTTRWTGVRFKDVLAEADLKPNATAVVIRAKDGFYESVSMTDMMDERTLLVYDMDGAPLTAEHGFPLRIYIPNRYGMKQPKWIETIEALEEPVVGYWVTRGWSKEAFVNTVSVVDTVDVDSLSGDGQSAVAGGIAWAGSRGISKVEVQVDDGPWEAAELITPALSPLTWVQWRYAWPLQSGSHEFKVRAYDDNGLLQIVEKNSPRPDGSTGIHSYSVRL